MEQEINIFGVYISPFVVMLGLGLVIFLPVRACLDYLQFDKYVWHRSLADACIYIITLGPAGPRSMSSIQFPDFKSEDTRRYLRTGVLALAGDPFWLGDNGITISSRRGRVMDACASKWQTSPPKSMAKLSISRSETTST